MIKDINGNEIILPKTLSGAMYKGTTTNGFPCKVRIYVYENGATCFVQTVLVKNSNIQNFNPDGLNKIYSGHGFHLYSKSFGFKLPTFIGTYNFVMETIKEAKLTKDQILK